MAHGKIFLFKNFCGPVMWLYRFNIFLQHGIAYAGNNMRKQPSPDPVNQVSKQKMHDPL